MTCPVCATPTVPGARFCFACGVALPASLAQEVSNERRVVTVLFGDLSDFTSWSEDLDPERVGDVTSKVLATLAAAVVEFGGHVDKLTGDGLMAVFGAPTAHEDDAERAVRAAARMQSAVRRVVEREAGGGRRLGLRVGLNTGEVVAGVQAHLSYTVVGDTVNTAARLSDAAGVGAVLAGRETAIVTLPAASWRAVPPLRLKGKREPVPAYELVALRPTSASRIGLGDQTHLVGRDDEFGLLVARMLDVADRTVPHTLVLSGEAGVGKTRLAQELARFAGELPGSRALWGRCTPYGEGRELSAVADMVRTACGIDESDDVEHARERLSRTLARLGQGAGAPVVPPGTEERLRTLLGLEDEPAPGPGTREAAMPRAAAGGDQLRTAVASLFTALAARGPLLLVLDDLHWATATMLEGVAEVARQTRGPVLLLAVGRPDLLGARPRGSDVPWWHGLPDVEVVPVRPLDDAATDALLQAYLGTRDDLDPAVRATMLSRAQGNPFFLAELLHLLVDRGALVRQGQRWRLVGHLPDDVLPAGVQAVLSARIDRLDGSTKGVLRDASVLGVRVTLPGLVAVGRASGHGDPEVVRAAVAELVERRLLEAAAPDPATGEPADGADDDTVLRFTHALVRDVAYAGLAKAERARRHAAAAWHEAQSAGLQGRSADVDGEIARHAERAVLLAAEMGLPRTDPAWAVAGLAFSTLARLGSSALARDEDDPAEALLRRALAVRAATRTAGTPGPDVLAVQVRHAQALARQHRLTEAEAALTGALAGDDPSLRAGALVVLGEVCRKSGNVAAARKALVAALPVAADAGADRLTAQALRELGLLDHFDGRLREAQERFRAAREAAARAGDTRGAAWALQHLAWTAATRGDSALADTVLGQAGALFRQVEDASGLAWVAGTESYVRLLQGRLAEAHALAQSVLPLGEAAGERWSVGVLLAIDGMTAAELGEVEVAAVQARRARALFAELSDTWGQALSLVAAGAAARGTGAPDEAVRLLEEAAALAERGRNPFVGSLALVSCGYAHLERGDVEAAARAEVRVTALLAGLDLEPAAALGAAVLRAQVLRARGRLEEALVELDEALAAPPDVSGWLFPRRQALAHRAGVLLQLGRVEEAVRSARSAVATPAEDVRAQVLAVRTLGLALRAVGETEEALRLLRQALALAESTARSEVAACAGALAG